MAFNLMNYHCISYSAKSSLIGDHAHKSMNTSSVNGLIVIIEDGFAAASECAKVGFSWRVLSFV